MNAHGEGQREEREGWGEAQSESRSKTCKNRRKGHGELPRERADRWRLLCAKGCEEEVQACGHGQQQADIPQTDDGHESQRELLLFYPRPRPKQVWRWSRQSATPRYVSVCGTCRGTYVSDAIRPVSQVLPVARALVDGVAYKCDCDDGNNEICSLCRVPARVVSKTKGCTKMPSRQTVFVKPHVSSSAHVPDCSSPPP